MQIPSPYHTYNNTLFVPQTHPKFSFPSFVGSNIILERAKHVTKNHSSAAHESWCICVVNCGASWCNCNGACQPFQRHTACDYPLTATTTAKDQSQQIAMFYRPNSFGPPNMLFFPPDIEFPRGISWFSIGSIRFGRLLVVDIKTWSKPIYKKPSTKNRV